MALLEAVKARRVRRLSLDIGEIILGLIGVARTTHDKQT
jgi:hypothetical protein